MKKTTFKTLLFLVLIFCAHCIKAQNVLPSNNAFRIRNVETGQYLNDTAVSSAAVTMTSSADGASTLFTFVQSGSFYNIDSQISGILRTPGASGPGGAFVVVSTTKASPSTDTDKIWGIQYNEANDTYRFESGTSGRTMYHNPDGTVTHIVVSASDDRSNWKLIPFVQVPVEVAPDEDTSTDLSCPSSGEFENTNTRNVDVANAVNEGTADDRTCYSDYSESNVNGKNWGVYNITDGSNHWDAPNTLQPRIERSLPRSGETGVGSFAKFTGVFRILEVGDTGVFGQSGTYIAQAKGKHSGGGGSPDPAICLYRAHAVYGIGVNENKQVAFDIYAERITERGGEGSSGREVVFLKRVNKNEEVDFVLDVGFREDPNDATKKIHYCDAIIGGEAFNYNIPEPERGLESGIRYGVYRVRGGRAQIRWANTTYNRIENEDTGSQNSTGVTITSTAAGDWNAGSTWIGGSVPTINDDVILDHGVTIKPGMTAVAKSLTLNSGGGSKRLNINEGSNLTVNGDVTLNRSQDGLFINYSSNATNKDIGTVIFNGAENDKKIYIRKRLPSNNSWHLISSSGRDSRQNEIARTATNSDSYNIVTNGTKNIFSIASYNGSNNADSKYEYIPDTGTQYANSISFAKSGYTVMVNNTSNAAKPDILLRPKLNADDVTESISANGDGYNLIGNPFLAYLHANTEANLTNNLLTVNSSVLEEQTIWIWDSAKSGGAGWKAINLGDLAYRINPVQGFFVKAKTSGGSAHNFSFTKAMRSHSKAGEFLKTSNNRFEIDLAISQGKRTTNTSVRYIENTTTDFDNGYDSSLFGGFSSDLAVYTKLVAGSSDTNLAIQSLPNSDFENMIIPVGVKATINSKITFKTQTINVPNGYKLYLEDRLNNTFTRLDEASAEYQAIVTESTTEGRFYIHVRSAVLSLDSELLDSVKIIKGTDATIKIVGLSQGSAQISLHNILGKQVLKTSFIADGVEEIVLPKLTQGIYIIQLETKRGSIRRKVILD